MKPYPLTFEGTPHEYRDWDEAAQHQTACPTLTFEGTPHEYRDWELVAMTAIVVELRRATSINGPFHSAHEGYAVIKEELDELWEEIKKKAVERDPEKLQKEAVQIGAMAARFIIDICMEGAWKV
ncbi:MAG TPA: hypothetical protein PK344_15995 [Syntrophorhabdaceae bacterium]|nr:hypothetical protein [Syntrophorhabdaceae bacterium]